MVVGTGIELRDEVLRRLDVGHHRVLELADLRLERVAAVEEDHVVAAGIDELVHLLRAQIECRRRPRRRCRPSVPRGLRT